MTEKKKKPATGKVAAAKQKPEVEDDPDGSHDELAFELPPPPPKKAAPQAPAKAPKPITSRTAAAKTPPPKSPPPKPSPGR
jgi:hypothetical protein